MSKTLQEIYCSFHLGDNEFALLVNHVQEVVNPPGSYTRVPLAPDYLLGMINLRGTIVPVVNLRSILKIESPAKTSSDQNKIAIVECGSVLIGLIFDSTGEVFRSRHEEKSEFTYSENQKHVISGAFKFNEGQRLIQIINPEALFNLEQIPHQNISRANSQEALKKKRGLRKQCISFFTGPARCALGMDSIQEILKLETLKSSPFTVDHCLGTIELRGNIVPVIDFAALLGYREPDRHLTATTENRRILVMRQGQELLGLMVDSVESIVSYYAEDLLPFPVLSEEKKKMFSGCISRENEMDIILLEQNEVLSSDEIHKITHGHSKIYQAADRRDQAKVKNSQIKTYITFHLGSLYAVSINEIREIIELPEALLHPPGLPEYFEGVLNLRGDLVTIVDTRTMYGIEKKDKKDTQRVLIFESQGGKFGLVVDAVDAIMNLSDDNKMRIPDILYKSAAGALSADVQEAVEVTLEASQKKTIMILNVGAITARIGQTQAA